MTKTPLLKGILSMEKINGSQGFIQDFEFGGGKQDGSRMIVACVNVCGY